MSILILAFLVSILIVGVPMVAVPAWLVYCLVRRRRPPAWSWIVIASWAVCAAGMLWIARGTVLDDPLARAAADGDTAEARRLLRWGAHPDRPGGDGSLPLVAAALEGDTAMVGLLVRAGADVDLPQRTGSDTLTALEAACMPEFGSFDTLSPGRDVDGRRCHKPAVAAHLRRLGARR